MFFETPVFNQQNIFCQPFNPKDIKYYQLDNKPLKQQCANNPEQYRQLHLDNATIILRLTEDQQLFNDDPDYDLYKELQTNKCTYTNTQNGDARDAYTDNITKRNIIQKKTGSEVSLKKPLPK